jgi:GT2 family glycosyltransferase
MTISVVIPTKDRPRELFKFINSLIEQSRKPNQVIIVDQSKTKLCPKTRIEKILIEKKIDVFYIHDESINGLVEAKNFSLRFNKCDIISFFDDDIVLTPNYLKNIEIVFKNNNHICGLNGLILNNPKQSFLKYWFFEITHVGIFRDNRNKAYRNKSENLIELDILSGGLSSWRAKVFNKIQFDTINKFHGMEDVEFSIRVRKIFPKSLYLTKNSHLYHYHSASNRKSEIKRVENDIIEGFKILFCF